MLREGRPVSEDEKQTAQPKRRSGSENRRRQPRVTFRVTPEEHAALEKAAMDAGLTVASYVRGVVLTAPKTKQRRRPSVEVEALARLLGAVNKVGGNIFQITKRVNFGETPMADEFHEALTGYQETVGAILATMGRGK
jgi:uncharacterized protein (DUF1778 family)